MTVNLNEDRLEIDGDITLEELVNRAKKESLPKNEILVQVKINEEALTQDQWEEIATEKVGDKDVQLLTESREKLSIELIDQAVNYLEDIQDWLDSLSTLNSERIQELEKVLEGFGWLNLALQQFQQPEQEELLFSGRPLEKELHANRMFLDELESALDKPENNQQLLTQLTFQELPEWLEEYNSIFKQLRDTLEGAKPWLE